MADLDFLDRAAPMIIVGADSSGIETTPAQVNDRQELEISDGIKSDILSGALVVGTSPIEVKVGSSRKSLRKGIFLFNNSNRTMFWGASGVTLSTGIPIERGESVTIRMEDVAIFVISDQAGLDARIVEF